MTDHTIEAHFKVTASCTSEDVNRDAWVIQEMALSVCPPGTPTHAIPPITIMEATRVYLMVCAMRLALEKEVGEPLKVEEVGTNNT